MNAGWTGRFAVEKNHDAFNTLAKNLIAGQIHSFDWPEWLPKKPITTAGLLSRHDRDLKKLKGRIDLLAGSPPCQGFSLAGRRLHSDPRNSLFRQYLRIVEKLKPRILLVENVQGFAFPFKTNGKKRATHKAYSEILSAKLKFLGYTVFSELVNFSEFGVPQNRNRFILIAIKDRDPILRNLGNKSPFDELRSKRESFLRSKALSACKPVSAKQALADLEVNGRALIDIAEGRLSGFQQIEYVHRNYSSFARLMRKGVSTVPDSLRLPRHHSATIRQFRKIMATCQRGKSLCDAARKRLKIKKQALIPLHPSLPASTVTTLPDDMIHYSEPRILTVRENARLQSFPDWFEFTGNYTTGGKNRRNDCPRYTQVGNAVPPLFSEAIGRVLKKLLLD